MIFSDNIYEFCYSGPTLSASFFFFFFFVFFSAKAEVRTNMSKICSVEKAVH